MRHRQTYSLAITAFLAVFFTVQLMPSAFPNTSALCQQNQFLVALPSLSISVTEAHANSLNSDQNQTLAKGNVKRALAACMAGCRARTARCYKSGNTGSCKNQHIACIASCQNSISGELEEIDRQNNANKFAKR